MCSDKRNRGKISSKLNILRQGFTLLELLVVVSVIALLISVLLPSLTRARDQAKRVHCASNLHQLGIALISYSYEYMDQLPTLYRSGSPFTTYWMSTPNTGDVNLGLLANESYSPEPKVYYCVTQNRAAHASLSFNGPDNKWDGDLLRSSYPARLVEVPMRRSPNTREPMRANELANWKLPDYARKVIYSDFIGVDGFKGGGIIVGYLYAPHKGQGFNRLFGDSSVQWGKPGRLTSKISDRAPSAEMQVNYYKELDILN